MEKFDCYSTRQGFLLRRRVPARLALAVLCWWRVAAGESVRFAIKRPACYHSRLTERSNGLILSGRHAHVPPTYRAATAW